MAVDTAKYRVIGTRPVRPDGVDKVTGRAVYGADVQLPRMAHGKVLRSPHAHARIVSIDTSKAAALPGVLAVVTGKDVSERAAPLPSFGAGPVVQDLIATEEGRHQREAGAAVLAEGRDTAQGTSGRLQ